MIVPNSVPILAPVAVFLPLHKRWADLILCGEKTLEVRRKPPKLAPQYLVYIYETSGSGGCGMVVGEFMCEKVSEFVPRDGRYSTVLCDRACLSVAETEKYGAGKTLYGLHARDAVRYKAPLPLSAFSLCSGKTMERPPQNYCYVERRYNHDD